MRALAVYDCVCARVRVCVCMCVHVVRLLYVRLTIIDPVPSTVDALVQALRLPTARRDSRDWRGGSLQAALANAGTAVFTLVGVSIEMQRVPAFDQQFWNETRFCCTFLSR